MPNFSVRVSSLFNRSQKVTWTFQHPLMISDNVIIFLQSTYSQYLPSTIRGFWEMFKRNSKVGLIVSTHYHQGRLGNFRKRLKGAGSQYIPPNQGGWEISKRGSKVGVRGFSKMIKGCQKKVGTEFLIWGLFLLISYFWSETFSNFQK